MTSQKKRKSEPYVSGQRETTCQISTCPALLLLRYEATIGVYTLNSAPCCEVEEEDLYWSICPISTHLHTGTLVTSETGRREPSEYFSKEQCQDPHSTDI